MQWHITDLVSYAPARIALTVVASLVALIVTFSVIHPAMLMDMVHTLMSMG